MGPGATQIYIPTDDPPPYSLTDPCQRNEISINISLEQEAAAGTTGQAANYAVRLQDLQQPISSISLSSLTLEAAPLYETVVCEQNIPIPLVPMEVLKNSSTDYQTLLNQIMWLKVALSFSSSEELRWTKTCKWKNKTSESFTYFISLNRDAMGFFYSEFWKFTYTPLFVLQCSMTSRSIKEQQWQAVHLTFLKHFKMHWNQPLVM